MHRRACRVWIGRVGFAGARDHPVSAFPLGGDGDVAVCGGTAADARVGWEHRLVWHGKRLSAVRRMCLSRGRFGDGTGARGIDVRALRTFSHFTSRRQNRAQP